MRESSKNYYKYEEKNMIALQVYEAEITKIKIPDFILISVFHDINVTGEIILGGYGYKIRAGEESGFSATAPNEYGGGFSFKLKREE